MFRRQFIMAGLFLGLVACQNQSTTTESKSPAVAESTDALAAKVNGDGITKVDYEAAVARNLLRYQGQGHKLPPGIEQRIKESVLRRLIDDQVVAQKAASIGATVTDAEITTKFEEHKKRFRTEQAFMDYLKRSNNTEENMKRDLRRNMPRDRVVETMSGAMQVVDEEVRKYYDDHIKRFIEKEQVKASRILIRVAAKAEGKERAAAKKKAQAIQKKAAKKNADFAALAKENSNGPEAGRGGELNWFSRGRMPPEFDNTAFALGKNAVSKVVETKLGYEIIKVWDKKAERQRPFEEVSTNIKNSLLARKRNEKRREVLRELKGGAEVEQFIKFERPVPKPGNPKVATPGKLDLQKKLKLQKPPVVNPKPAAAAQPAPEAKN